MPERKTGRVLCPRCGKPGFMSSRRVESTYYPQFGSVAVSNMQCWCDRHAKNPDDENLAAMYQLWSNKIKGNRYRGEHLIGLTDSLNVPQDFDRGSCYRVIYGKYLQYYFAHYDPKKYQKQMKDYKAGRRKSKPNGRRECKLRINRDLKSVAMKKLA